MTIFPIAMTTTPSAAKVSALPTQPMHLSPPPPPQPSTSSSSSSSSVSMSVSAPGGGGASSSSSNDGRGTHPHALRYARHEEEQHQAELRTYQQARKGRPENTSRAWDSRALEFIQWCIVKKGFADRDTVTGSKLHLFLLEEVVYRKKRRPGRPSQKNPRVIEAEEVIDWN
jgi:hypothetical protein